MKELTNDKAKIISYLTFSIAGEYFGLNVGKVLNILDVQTITKIPMSPEYMRGVINLRGEVLPLIDAKNKLGLGFTEITSNTCILVIEAVDKNRIVKFGAMVDSVHEVLEIEDKMILPPPAIGNQYQTELIIGVVEQDDKFTMILDINKLLETNEILQISKLKETVKK